MTDVFQIQEQLKPCPFCGARNEPRPPDITSALGSAHWGFRWKLDWVHTSSEHGHASRVSCRECGSVGPLATTYERAAIGWNSRK